jgi:hypothetical protein
MVHVIHRAVPVYGELGFSSVFLALPLARLRKMKVQHD